MKKVLGFIVVLSFILIGVSTYAYFTNYYTIAFIVDGVGTKVKVKKNSDVSKINIPKKDGYKFLYWMDDYTIVDENYVAKSDAVLVALFEKIKEEKKYTVTFDTDGGSDIDKIVVIENKQITEPEAPIKEGYTFKEWQLDDVTYDFELPVIKNITLKAIYIKNSVPTFTVSFNTDGGSVISKKVVEVNGKVNKPSNPIKTGYTFKYWSLNGNVYNFNTPVTKNITLKAIYQLDERKTYTVSFDSAGGSEIYSQTVKENEYAVIPSTPFKLGYKFENWLLDNNAFDFTTPITKNITLKAVYTKLNEEAEKNSYVVSFNSNGGSNVERQLIEEGSKVIVPANPTKEGYTFKEWQLNGQSYNFDTPVTSVITLFAVYEENGIIKVKDITLSKTSIELNKGGKTKIDVTISPEDATNKNVTWESSDTNIVDVSNGTIIALKEGNAIITVTVDGVSKDCNVVVVDNTVYSYEIENNYIYIKANNTYVSGSLTITYDDETSESINVSKNGYLLPDKNVVSVTNIKVS